MRARVDRRRLWFGVLNLALVLLCALAMLAFSHIRGLLDSIRAAERWRGENELRFAQVACFLPEDGALSSDQVLSFRASLEQEFINASLKAPEGGKPAQIPEDQTATMPSGTLYADAYSARGNLSVSAVHGTAQIKAIGVGGEFFLFHPLRLRSGSYLSPKDLMQDRVVLDEELAWQLFGGTDVAGMCIEIAGEPYYVAGVVTREQDFASQAAYLDGAGLFMSYDALEKLTGAKITCYEIVLPDMISGFGLGLVEKSFPIGKGDIVQNTGRYGLKQLLSVAGDFGQRSMRSNGVIYPYWENAVRMTEDYLSLLLVLAIFFALCPVITVIVLVIRAITGGGRWLKRRVPATLDAAIEKRKERNYAKVGE